MGQPQYGRGGGAPHRGAIVLVLGIFSLIMGLPAIICFCLIFPLAFPAGLISLALGIPAIVMARTDLEKMNRNQMDRSGYGTTNAGFILAIIGVVLSILGIIGGIAFLILFIVGQANQGGF